MTAEPGIGAQVAAEALAWVDTPVRWNQSQKGVGCDCKGLVQGVARELGRPEAQSFHGLFVAYRRDRPVPVKLLKQGLAELLDRVECRPEDYLSHARDGDVLLIEVGGRPQHLAIVAEGATRAVHADGWGAERVKSRNLEALLRARKLNSAWRWRSGD